MRWCRYRSDDTVTYGVVEDDSVLEAEGDPFGGHRLTGVKTRLDDVRLLPPVIPSTFFCVGMNYLDHIRDFGADVPERPQVGYRANNALAGHGDAIVRPADCTGRFEAEGELV